MKNEIQQSRRLQSDFCNIFPESKNVFTTIVAGLLTYSRI